jgi:hypothetical protein
MLVLAALTVIASATGDCKEYPFEPKDPDSNGTLGVMTREPRGAVAAGSLAYLDVHGPSQYYSVNGEVPGWELPPTWLKDTSAEPAETLELAAVWASSSAEEHVYATWVGADEFREAGADEWSLSNRLLVRAGQPGIGRLSVSAKTRYSREFYDVEDVFEIPVEPVDRLDASLDSGGDGVVLLGEAFLVQYEGFSGSTLLHGVGYFRAEIEPQGALSVDDITRSDISSGDYRFAASPRAPKVSAVATQTGSATIRPQPAGAELSVEVIEPAAVSHLTLQRLEQGETLSVYNGSTRSVSILASVDDRALYTPHQNLLAYQVEVLDVDGGFEVCALTSDLHNEEPETRLLLDDREARSDFIVVAKHAGNCEIQVTHLLSEGSGASAVFPVEIIE